ncbi:hypothetical protein AAY473_028102 [Plecturocebus cupreus]
MQKDQVIKSVSPSFTISQPQNVRDRRKLKDHPCSHFTGYIGQEFIVKRWRQNADVTRLGDRVRLCLKKKKAYWQDGRIGTAPVFQSAAPSEINAEGGIPVLQYVWYVMNIQKMFVECKMNSEWMVPGTVFPDWLWEAFCEVFCEGPLACHGFSKSLFGICDVPYPVLGAVGLCNGDGSGDSKQSTGFGPCHQGSSNLDGLVTIKFIKKWKNAAEWHEPKCH